MIAQVAFQPKVTTSSATTTVRPAAGPLTCKGTADDRARDSADDRGDQAHRPARRRRTAIPIDNGRATRNTTSEAGHIIAKHCV